MLLTQGIEIEVVGVEENALYLIVRVQKACSSLRSLALKKVLGFRGR